jgi:vancomycin resistance protein YoaR
MVNLTKMLVLTLLLLPLVGAKTVLAEEKNANQKKIIIQVDEYQEELGPETLSQWIKNQPRLEINSAFRSEIENIKFCPTDLYPCELILPTSALIHFQKTDRISIDSQKIASFVDDLARRINKDPIDAKFKVENDRVTEFASSQSGIQLKNNESVSALEEAAKKIAARSVSENIILKLPFAKLEPAIKNNEGNGLGIATLIGEGTSNFARSPKNRIFNIRVATERFNGILIKPGEDFSFVTILGEVDGEHGYLPELVIKKDKTEPEFGGGICQVSTTAFRAAIYSGLKITARRNHAYPVSYYNPQGMDATVYVPRPDLRFLNNTPGYILIQTKIEGTILKFQFYGTNDGRKTEVIGPTVTQRNPDGSLKATFTQNVFDKDGKQIINDVFNSNYESPNKYPHPGQETKLTTKPNGWSDGEWKAYKKANGI